MTKFRLKPNHKKIDLSTIENKQVDFICNMGIINKIIAKRNGTPWSDETQAEFDEKIKVYFLVKKNLEYDVLFGNEIDELITSKGLTVQELITDNGRKCIDHFIKSL